MNLHQKVPYALVPPNGRTMRFYYYASPLADGRWELQSSRKVEPVRYAGKGRGHGRCRVQLPQAVGRTRHTLRDSRTRQPRGVDGRALA
jgi:hypothetical protein